MKTLNLVKSILVVLVLTSCSAQKMIVLPSGEEVTERQYDRSIKRIYKKTLREMSKEDRKIIESTHISVETE